MSLEVDIKASCKARKVVHLSHLLESQPVRNQLEKSRQSLTTEKSKDTPLCTLSEGRYEILSSAILKLHLIILVA